MNDYLQNKVLSLKVDDGLIIVERDTSTGKRIGVVGLIDLEEYSYIDNNHLIVASEDYVEKRLKARIEIREKASLELSHAIVFTLDDDKEIYKVYKKCQKCIPLYDFNLMENGGHLRGWKIAGEEKELLLKLLNTRDLDNEPIMIVGDGNHSLASAKVCWENYKANNPSYPLEHPLRYAMVELESLNSEAIKFYPIHRFIYNVPFSNLCSEFVDYLKRNKIKNIGNSVITIKSKDDIRVFNFRSTIDSIKILQDFLDEYRITNGYDIDYIHDEGVIKKLIKENRGTAIFIEPIDKSELFNWVKENGHLPKKTFSIGMSNEKRYYLESRIIK